jgi:hypothetical protein
MCVEKKNGIGKSPAVLMAPIIDVCYISAISERRLDRILIHEYARFLPRHHEPIAESGII